ncbi:GATOR complex protein NPRL2-like isoform X2 [Biomphalaria glabrata]|uniref:GATOR complex protein NPRL2-like isoform X2 n=1 Tax=Biomphalaria glabrata TaxID=6526 RepID=A0A9W3A8Q9_BIOGL|nr:GATOR complex protein NPRL2-like isoform X2 [Biomphalaria glabrata]
MPKIIVRKQVPQEHVSKEMFDAIQQYIITKPELQNRIITLTSFGCKFVGCPVCIDNSKYQRNAFIFNICFVFNEGSSSTPYCSVVKKLASYLTQLEDEHAFLSNPENTEKVSQFLKQVHTDLNTEGYCSINMGTSCIVHLKRAAVTRGPITVQDHDVPVLIKPRDVVMKHQWDLTTQQILHYVDGVSHVLKIAAEADVELNLVKADLQNLLYYKLLALVPIFQYSNVYTVTRDINTFMEDERLQLECIDFVAKSERALPDYVDIFSLYCSFTHGTTVKDICTRQMNPHIMKVNERKLVLFGVMKGLIRRVHKFPIALKPSAVSSKLQPIVRFLDGKHNFDQICALTGLSHHELDERCEADESIVVCCK